MSPAGSQGGDRRERRVDRADRVDRDARAAARDPADAVRRIGAVFEGDLGAEFARPLTRHRRSIDGDDARAEGGRDHDHCTLRS
jgi:hypothetical protein